jgi:hypothetical protein
MASTPLIPDYIPGFEILTKHKEAIRQLVHYASIPIPKLAARYKVSYTTIRRIFNYKVPNVHGLPEQGDHVF